MTSAMYLQPSRISDLILCTEMASLDDKPMLMSDWENGRKTCDFSLAYERKALYEATEGDDQVAVKKLPKIECKCSGHASQLCGLHRRFLPSLEAIDEEVRLNESEAVDEVEMKYDLTLSHRHYSTARNKGYLHKSGRHYRKKAYAKNAHDDFPRRERSVTF